MEEDVMIRLERGEIVIVGDKMYRMCADCGKIVCINKTIFGSLHFCEKERRLI
jgi:hypothetical protein